MAMTAHGQEQVSTSELLELAMRIGREAAAMLMDRPAELEVNTALVKATFFLDSAARADRLVRD